MNREAWRYTTDELDAAERVKAAGETWEGVGIALGVPWPALKAACLRRRRGARAGVEDAARALRARVIEEAEAGRTRVPEIARMFGISYHYAYKILVNAGFDAEMRREYARGS